MADVLPPHSAEIEEALLGSLMIDPTSIALVETLGLKPDDFYIEKNGWIYEAVLAQGEAADVLTVGHALDAQGLLDDVGGEAYLAQLTGAVPTALNAGAYTRAVRDLAERRHLIHAAREIARTAYDQKLKMADVRQTALDVTAKAVRTDAARMQTSGAVLQSIWERLEAISRGEISGLGMQSGWKDLDRLTFGVFPSELTILGARPSMGKSTFLINFADGVAVKQGKKVCVFSAEMNAETWMSRSVAAESDVDYERIRLGTVKDEDWTAISTAMVKLGRGKMWIDDTPAIDIRDMQARARRLHMQEGLDLVVVDYIQLLRAGGLRTTSRNEIVGEIGWGLKQLARELNVPVVAAAQVGRGVDERADKRPLLSDLRESGSLEAHADAVLFLYRDEVYNPTTEAKGVAEVICAKNRNGPTGTATLYFDKVRQRYSTVVLSKRILEDG